MKTNTESESAVPQQTTLSIQEDSQKDKELNGKIQRRLKKIQEGLDPRMKNFNFEIEVFFHEQKALIEEAFQKNLVFNQDIPAILNKLKEYELTPELLGVYERTEQLDYAYENNELLRQQVQNPLREILQKLEEGLIGGLKTLDVKPCSPEMIQKFTLSSKLNASKAELMFMILKKMGLFQLKVDEDGWLGISFRKGNHKEISFEEVKGIEKINLRIERIEHLEMVLYALNFLLENCLEKVLRLCLNFTTRYISNQEAEKFNKCGLWKNHKLDLAVDFRECTFESEDTPLRFFRDQTLDNLEGFRWYFGDSNATQKTVNDLCKLIESRIKNLKFFAFDATNLAFHTIQGINAALLNKASDIHLLEFGFGGTPFSDEEMIFFSEKVLPELKSLQHIKFWLGASQVTDKGFKSLFKSIEKNCANRLQTFLLRISDSHITDESIEEFALKVLPLMENLEELSLSFQRTLVTDKSMIELCRNLKKIAPKLKRFGLNLGGLSVTDAMIDLLALESMPLMKQLTYFDIWLNRTKVTEKGLGRLFSSMVGYSVLEEFEINCTETPITDENLIMFANKALNQMVHLKKFTLFASKTKLSDSSLKTVFQNLSGASHLYKLAVWLNEVAIEEESLVSLAESIPSLVNLGYLSLSLDKTKLGDLGMSRLCESLKSVAQNLEILRLDLDDTRVTDQGVLTLGNEIASEMRSLKELKLWVSRTKVGDAGLKPLFENLAVDSLQVLDIFLNGSLVTDQSVLALAEKSLSKAENLRAVEFRAANTNLSDLSLVPLMHRLRNKVENVNKLNLVFQNTKMTNQAMEMLDEVLVNTMNLREFQLNLGPFTFSNGSMSMFYDGLAKKAQRLKKLVLNVNSALSDERIRLLADTVLPHLNHVQEFKIIWSVRLTSPTYKALCMSACKGIKNIKTFNISSSQFSVTSGSSLKELSFELNKASINDSDMRQILESFEGQQLSQVKTFSFKVENTNISNSSIKTLAEKLFLFMPNLETLKLALDQIPLSNEAFCFMCRSFENFAGKLKSISTSLRLPTLNDSSINTFADCGLANMINLESFDVDFYSDKNHHIEPSVLVNFFGKMQHCVKKLSNFSLSMFHLNLAPEVIQTFATQVFPNLESLTDIYLSLHDTGINDSEFATLLSGFKNGNLKKNKYFGIAIFEPALSGSALEVISTEILPQLKNVEIFGFYILANEKFQDDNFIKFSKSFQEIASQIAKIILKYEHSGITDEGIKEFGLKTLPAMKSLKTADISFGSTTGIKDEGMIALLDGFGTIVERLSSLDLCLSKTGITDAGIEMIKKREDLEIWKRSSLDISDNGISKENQSFINQHFKK